MKKIGALLTLAVLAAAAWWGFQARLVPESVNIEKTIFYTTDGREIIADSIQDEGGTLVYYSVDGRSNFIHRDHILTTETMERHTSPERKLTVIQYLQHRPELIRVSAFRDNMAARISSYYLRYRVYIDAVLLLVATAVAWRLLHRTLKRRRDETRERRETTGTYQPAVTNPDLFINLRSELVVRHFLRLYKQQINADPHAGEAINKISMDSEDSIKRTYELKVWDQDNWKIRRMSITPLGESSGSKSTCFYVIFDVHLVVKIPSEPIREFDVYCESIRADREIARKLSPRECIVPYISVVMSRISPVENISRLSIDRVEEKYVDKLINAPDLQDYLKIGDSFVFFMDLSRFFFLGDILKNMHNIGPRIAREILANPTLIWNETGFENRYGAACLYICRDLIGMYTEFCTGIKEIEKEEKIQFESFQVRKWFPVLLSGHHLTVAERGPAPRTAERIHQVFNDLAMKNSDVLSEYKDTIKTYVKKIAFRQHKPQMESLCSNLLELLAWMGDKGVAMRDLKPDNLMVTGDRERYPAFLTSPKEYSIGLIDVETAVDFNPPPEKAIKQPFLGGSPYYATPSHLFTNEMIVDMFEDLPAMFHLQDWYATIGIIYKVVIGDHLFEQTGKQIPVLTGAIEKAFSTGENLVAVAKETSREFWKSSREEFYDRLDAGRDTLSTIRIRIPDNFRSVLIRLVNRQQEKTISKIKTVVYKQPYITSDKLRDALVRTSSQQIQRHKPKWMESPSIGLATKRNDVSCFLDKIAELKHTAEKLALGANSIQPYEHPVLPADELLEYMYRTIHAAMHAASDGF